jgi:hypothetical protein
VKLAPPFTVVPEDAVSVTDAFSVVTLSDILYVITLPYVIVGSGRVYVSAVDDGGLKITKLSVRDPV